MVYSIKMVQASANGQEDLGMPLYALMQNEREIGRYLTRELAIRFKNEHVRHLNLQRRYRHHYAKPSI